MPGYLVVPSVNAAGMSIIPSGNVAASNVQSAVYELDSEKAAVISPTFTGTVVLPSTTTIGNVSNTELGYIDGVTSSVQNQITSVEALAMLGL